jgi:thiamine biosynthesis lipoprotein
MGMPVGIDVCDPGVSEAAIEDAFAWLRAVDATFSTFRPDSEISRLNRGELDRDGCSPDVRHVLHRCEHLRLRTAGYFDATATGCAGIDPSGLVKGWAVERAARILERAGARNYIVNAGGDVQLSGSPEGHGSWRVGIQHPRRRDAVAAVLSMRAGAVATSGAYERGDHVRDPHTGAPPVGVLSATVVGPSLEIADAYATAAFAMGEPGAMWIARQPGYAGMVILDDDTVLSTPAFELYRDGATRA